jgi:hypothetical protein
MRDGLMRRLVLLSLTAAICAAAAFSLAAKGKPVPWKLIEDAIFRVNDVPVKEWNVYQTGKKTDPLLLQIGARFLFIQVKEHKVFEIDPSKIQHKADDLLWDPSDRPAQPIDTSAWDEGDVGTAFRVETKINSEKSTLVLDLPHPPDIGSLPVRVPSQGQRGGGRRR